MHCGKFIIRFVFSIFSSSIVKHIQQNENEIFKQEESYLKTLELFLTALYKNDHKTPYDVMKEELGFVIKKRKSVIEGAGDGVVVTEGCIKKSCLVALYPGLFDWLKFILVVFILWVEIFSFYLKREGKKDRKYFGLFHWVGLCKLSKEYPLITIIIHNMWQKTGKGCIFFFLQSIFCFNQ